MRPFTRAHRILAAAVPFAAGIGSGLLLEPVVRAPVWWLGIEVLMAATAVLGLVVRLRRRRRRAELVRASHQRGWREGRPAWCLLTESEVEEMGRMYGEDLAATIREVAVVRRVEDA